MIPPTPPPIKTIINVTARPVCTALHHIVLPFAAVEKQNNAMYQTMDRELGVYRGAGGDGPMETGAQGTYTSNGVQLVQAGKIDQQATQMAQALTDLEKQLAQSYKDIPVGKDPKLDELRARMDNVIKLQYALASRYDGIAARTLGTVGFMPAVETPFRNPPDYSAPGVDYDPKAPNGAVQSPAQSVKAVGRDFILNAPAADVRKGMIEQETGFVQPAVDAVNLCDPK